MFDSGYDLRTSTYFAPDSTNLTDHPVIRSQFQRALGSLNLELELDRLAKDPKIRASMKKMYEDIRSGKRAQFNARDYYHNRIIDRLFKRAKKTAWLAIKDDPNVARLIERQRLARIEQINKRIESANILNIYK